MDGESDLKLVALYIWQETRNVYHKKDEKLG